MNDYLVTGERRRVSEKQIHSVKANFISFVMGKEKRKSFSLPKDFLKNCERIDEE
jgi:hypothetical protein